MWLSNIIDIWNWLTLCDKRKMLKLCITQCQNILDGLMPITFLQYCSFGRRLEPGRHWLTHTNGSCIELQGECISGASRGSDDDQWQAHCGWHLLQLLPAACWLEICIVHLHPSAFGCQYHVIRPSQKLFNPIYWLWQESAYEKSQKYKEGKFILER